MSRTLLLTHLQQTLQCLDKEEDDEDGLTLSQLQKRWWQHDILDSQENPIELRGRDSLCKGKSLNDEGEVELRGVGLEALTWPLELLHVLIEAKLKQKRD